MRSLLLLFVVLLSHSPLLVEAQLPPGSVSVIIGGATTNTTFANISDAVESVRLTVSIANPVRLALSVGVFVGAGNRNINLTGFAGLTIEGQGSANTIIDLESADRFAWTINGRKQLLRFSGFSLRNGNITIGIDNLAAGLYFFNTGGNVTFDDVMFSSFYAAGRGGALYFRGYESRTIQEPSEIMYATISNSVFTSCNANLGGGAIHGDLLSRVTLANVNVTRCSTRDGSGGGLSGLQSTIIIQTRAVFRNNTADRNGGAIYLDSCAGNDFRGLEVSDNVAGGEGGGLVGEGATVTCNSCVISRNRAVNGGAVSFTRAGSSFFTSTLSDNVASNNGGAGYVGTGSLNLYDSTVSGNRANNGGGIAYQSSGSAVLLGGTFSGNSAKNGGALWTTSARVQASGVSFVGNSATDSGGAIYCSNSKIELSDTVLFSGNSAEEDTDLHCSDIVSNSICDVTGSHEFAGRCAVDVESGISTITGILLIFFGIFIGCCLIFIALCIGAKGQLPGFRRLPEGSDYSDDERAAALHSASGDGEDKASKSSASSASSSSAPSDSDGSDVGLSDSSVESPAKRAASPSFLQRSFSQRASRR